MALRGQASLLEQVGQQVVRVMLFEVEFGVGMNVVAGLE